MAAATHEQKRDLLQSDFLLGKLEPGEIDTLATRARVSLSPTGKEVVLNVIHAGEVFGEIAVIDGEERTAGAAAMTDCELLIIDRRDVRPMFERHLEICDY